ncbi:hypothetical protein DFO69_3965 [Bacillus subtilis]|nr:hypothetical protein DFO69_3965 [Bacillus subtilis]
MAKASIQINISIKKPAVFVTAGFFEILLGSSEIDTSKSQGFLLP